MSHKRPNYGAIAEMFLELDKRPLSETPATETVLVQSYRAAARAMQQANQKLVKASKLLTSDITTLEEEVTHLRNYVVHKRGCDRNTPCSCGLKR